MQIRGGLRCVSQALVNKLHYNKQGTQQAGWGLNCGEVGELQTKQDMAAKLAIGVY